MKYVNSLNDAESATLRSAHKNHLSARVRTRAQIILLSSQGYYVKEIAAICRMTRQAVSDTIDRWEQSGLAGLYDRPRPGQPRKLTPEDERFILDLIDKEPRSVTIIIATLEDQRGRKVSRATVKRVLKKHRVWKRIRKSLKGKRDGKRFRAARTKIENLEKRRDDGEIELYYFDESGFNLTPCVPYAWQPKGEYIEVPAAKSESLNVLAFMNKDNDCTSFVFNGSVDTDVVVECFNRFSLTLNKKTFVIMDNAPVHKNKKFYSRLPEWHAAGLNIRFLPPYSPELNLIEILWRKMKYEWLPFRAYLSFSKLTDRVNEILLNLGSQYVIEFV